MPAGDLYDSPNEDSPTIGIELAIDSAREDIISHVSDAAAIILLANGHFIVGSLVALYWETRKIRFHFRERKRA